MNSVADNEVKNSVELKEAPKREIIVNDESKFHAAFGTGDVVAQGDVLLIGISKVPSHSLKTNVRQLAPGNTQGSRHVMTRGDIFNAPLLEVQKLIKSATGREVPMDYIGPVFVSPKDPTADDLAHPEHGNHGFPEGQVVAVVYQRTLDVESRLARRMRD